VGDVRNLDPSALEVLRGQWLPPYDVVFWWHGPEHISEHEIGPTVKGLEQIARELVILACPWGDSKLHHAPEGKIPGQRHKAKLYKHHFRSMGYKVASIGKRDGRNRKPSSATHILAWKWINQ
jgi:hypothetical protein